MESTAKEDGDSLRRTLACYLDTLLPADSTPSASQLGVDRALVTQAGRELFLARLLVRGCSWLDTEAAKRGSSDFATLGASDQEIVVSIAERSPRDSLPRTFFDTILPLAYREYYARPESWIGLGFAGPPQPLGFPDHAEPPLVDRQ